MTDIPELTEQDFARAIPASVRQRLMLGRFESGQDVVALRRFVALTQAQFAQAMGISVHTLRNWEQDRRRPEGPAIALLRISARHPRILRENLESAHSSQPSSRPRPRPKGLRTILLGAGASIQAGVPGTTEMVRTIYESLKASDARVAESIQVVIGGLKFHKSIEQGDPFHEVDIEDVYGALKMLEDRKSTFLSPFVGSWSHAIQYADRPDLTGSAQRLAHEIGESISEGVRQVADFSKERSRPFVDSERIRRPLEEAFSVACGQGESVFPQAAEAVKREIVKRAWVSEPSQVKYLEALLASSSRERLWIATLNYDNAIELAASGLGLTVDLGISNGDSPIRFPEDSPICLAKLHGSVTWGYDHHGHFGIVDRSAALPALIFGSGNKLRIDGPYLDLLFAFRERLQQTDELWVCGYSFRDAHVNHLLLGWLKADPVRSLRVCDPYLTTAAIERNASQAMPEGWNLIPGGLETRIKLEAVDAGEWVARYFQPSLASTVQEQPRG